MNSLPHPLIKSFLPPFYCHVTVLTISPKVEGLGTRLSLTLNCLFTPLYTFSAVMVSIPVMASVFEGDGSVEICVMLAAIVNTGRAVTVNLTTYTGTGKFFRIMVCA